jgi:acetyltransferase-like isoleucine patch superfamily enzyme/coenzyme F420-reducing hydrogenase beta subunit
MIKIADKIDCCCCNACGDICAHRAITFKPDNEGFLYPTVDTSRCVNCGLCETVCPILNTETLQQKAENREPECFAAQHKNLQALFDSTSGCAFVALADRMYKEGGFVGGAIFNEDYSVSQFISSNKSDLERLRNSKYVQSDSQGFFIAVRDLLRAGEKVLVCGLPCQMAGLRTFLRKDYENLIVVDLICLGINSPKILPAYLHYLEEKHKSKIVYYKAKNKELGWRNLTTKVVFENGEVEYDKADTNYFTVGFIGTHAFARPSCYACRFKGFPRYSDITIGDFWGAEKHVGRELDNNLGTSVILANTAKGLAYYQTVKSAFRECQVPLKAVVAGNPALVQSLSKPLIDRTLFYKDLDEKPFIEFARKYIKRPVDNPLTLKRKIRNWLSFGASTMRASAFSPATLWKNLYYNLLSRQFETNIALGHFITIHKYCVLDISSHARVVVKGRFAFGPKRIKKSKLESRLLVEDGATLQLSNGSVMYGADIEVFKNATLSLGNGIIFNINATIICGDRITIDDNVCFGRDVTVRDNSGNHFMSRRMFKSTRPITIGQHAWLTEHVIVMPGAKIGVGVIVSAGSLVSGKLPNFVLATGSPAKVVDEEIYWKC